MRDLINVFKMFSDETRLRIIILLLQQELCVCQISGILDISQPKVSKHLSKLRDLGYVSDERIEKFVYYRLEKENVILTNIANDILSRIQEYPQLGLDQSRLADKDKYLNQCALYKQNVS
jgi:ArsR family transcriptional regulator